MVAYASRTLTKSKQRYSTTQNELLAVVTFLQHFGPYLLGQHFVLRTDHSSLTWLRNFKEPEGQLARWLEQLEEYTFDIVHRRGKLHTNADALSRLPGTKVQDTSVVMSVVCLPVYAPQDVRDHQLADSLVVPLLKAKEANEKATI